jgi:acyl-coenzyme A synthetase/AMP-(fatty) acid ligase/thioesterase domain-containing protein/acyl carrier protein
MPPITRTSNNARLRPIELPGDAASLLQRWDDVVRAQPDLPAIASPGSSLTFAEADALSDRIAVDIAARFPGDDTPLGVFVDHTALGLLGLLATVKAGRIVVMFDAHVPAERRRDISVLAGIGGCLASADHLDAAAELAIDPSAVMSLDASYSAAQRASAAARGLSAHDATADAANAFTPEQLAVLARGRARSGTDPVLVVFTSGSSGAPKGVIQTHNALMNDVMTMTTGFRITPQDRVALVLPFGFAAGSSLFFDSVLNGASVWAFDPRDGGVRGLISFIENESLTVLACTPHLARSIVASLPPGRLLSSIRLISTVGEAIHGRDVDAIRACLPPTVPFINWVGSSEVGVLAMHEIPAGAPVPQGTIPAGRVVENKEVRLLRDDSTPAAPGEAGEILTVSAYLSGGYWGDDTANAARFSDAGDGRRICRQGDLGRFDDNGDLVLLGRADSAVKVRGYLVEPSEIEAAFLEIDSVTEAVVVTVVDPPAPTRLIAYVAQETSQRPHSVAALRRFLRLQLPEYMVPATIVPLSSLPRNDRGKVDRQQLPAVPPVVQSTEPMEPRELVLSDIWAEVLGLEFVGLDDDFMALGGDSLSAEELFAIVRERFGIALASTDLVESPTLREFARRVELGATALPSHPDVVTLRSGGIRTPLFCFAGAGALALTFLPLARHFPDHDMYAFQSHGLEVRAWPDQSVEAAATRNLQLMRIIQPRGPYLLIGHSYGGLVALEMARQLTQAGETVEMVTLLDTYLPLPTARKVSTPEVRRSTPEAGTSEAGRSTPLAAGKRFVRGQVERVLPLGLPERAEWARHARARVAGVVRFRGQKQFDALFDKTGLVSRKYHLKPYDGRVLLVIADANPDGEAAWSGLLTGSHEIVHVRSEHSSLIREPYASEVAAAVQSELDRLAQ